MELKKMMILILLAIATMGLQLVGCGQEAGTETSAETTLHEESTDTTAKSTTEPETKAKAETETEAETETKPAETEEKEEPVILSDDPIDALSIKRGINVSTLEYGGIQKEIRLSLRDPFTDETFENIKNAGFDHVRFPVNFAEHYSDGKVSEAFLAEVDEIIAMMFKQDLTVILDFHGWREINYDVASNKAKLYDIWEQVAEHYKDYPYTLLFELLNEPHEEASGADPLKVANLNMIQTEVIKIIRETNPKRIIVAACAFYNNARGLQYLADFPEDDRNIIVDVHNYHTIEFTHQGSELWMNPEASRLPRRISAEEYTGIDTMAKYCKEYMEKTGRKIWLGEFGLIVAVPKTGTIADLMNGGAAGATDIELGPVAKEEDITAYLSYLMQAMNALDIPYAWWEYDLEFGAYDLIKQEWRALVMDSIMPQD